MILPIKPLYIEPGFKIYYFDMVYSYPHVLEIDLLITFRGGILSIELEREGLESLSRKSLKYFLNGFTRYPVTYFYPSIDNISPSNVGISMPVVMDCSTLKSWAIFNELLRLGLYRILPAKEAERSKIFAIDNFLCSLLLYGAPAICENLFMDASFMKHIESSSLALRRVKIIKEVKRLRSLGDWENPNITNQSMDHSENLQAKSMITFIPILENENLRKQIAKSLIHLITEKPSLAEIRVLHTKESRKHAEEIINEVKTNLKRYVDLANIEVERSSITARIRELIINELGRDTVLLIIGEFPKRELLKLVDVAQSYSIECKLLIWRPRIRKDLNAIIEDIEKKCSLEEIEKLELQAVSI